MWVFGRFWSLRDTFQRLSAESSSNNIIHTLDELITIPVRWSHPLDRGYNKNNPNNSIHLSWWGIFLEVPLSFNGDFPMGIVGIASFIATFSNFRESWLFQMFDSLMIYSWWFFSKFSRWFGWMFLIRNVPWLIFLFRGWPEKLCLDKQMSVQQSLDS